MNTKTAVSHKIIDLRGHRCPHLLIAAINAVDALENGRVLQIIADDLTAPSNLAAWCRQSNHPLLDVYEENGNFIFFVQKHVP